MPPALVKSGEPSFRCQIPKCAWAVYAAIDERRSASRSVRSGKWTASRRRARKTRSAGFLRDAIRGTLTAAAARNNRPVSPGERGALGIGAASRHGEADLPRRAALRTVELAEVHRVGAAGDPLDLTVDAAEQLLPVRQVSLDELRPRQARDGREPRVDRADFAVADRLPLG